MATMVTGGTGFVGSNVVRTLAQHGHEVICFDLVAPDILVRRYLQPWADQVTFVQGDILSLDDLERVARHSTVTKIVHAAVFTPSRTSNIEMERSRSIVDINLVGTANLLDLACRMPLERFLYVSSEAVYGEGHCPSDTLQEDAALRPGNLYAVTNSAATGAPGIDGSAVVGQTLTATTSVIVDDDGIADAVFNYQWLAGDEAVKGATASTYTVVAGDAGKVIKVRVTFTDDAGNEESLTSQATAAVTQPLTATIHGAPDSHDGRKKFTFELRFSDELKQSFSFKTLRDHAFTVTGGKVVRAKRLEKDENARWEIHVRPDSNNDVTVVLPATTDCDAQEPSARRTAGCCPARWS